MHACCDGDCLENRSMQRKEFPQAAAPRFQGGVTNQRCDAMRACMQNGESSRQVTMQPEHVVVGQGHTPAVKEFPREKGRRTSVSPRTRRQMITTQGCHQREYPCHVGCKCCDG
jgi:hypothetical protein